MTSTPLQHTPQLEQLTSAVLIIANVIPLFGVLFYDWSLPSVMLLYWLENIVVGAINVVRILFISESKHFFERIFTSIFFIVHYGIFCAAHGSLLLTLLSIEIEGLQDLFSPTHFLLNASLVFGYIENIMGVSASLALFAMLISHGFSLRTHYFKGGERHRVTTSTAMHMPYQRIIVMHIGLIGGAFLIQRFESTVVLLLALIAAKIAVDVMFHRKEHRRLLNKTA